MWKISIASFLLAGCAPSTEELKKVFAENPDIVFLAIEKDPERFVDLTKQAINPDYRQRQKESAQENERLKKAEAPIVDEKRISLGPKNAAVTIIIFSDFLTCYKCPQAEEGALQMLQRFPNQVRIVYRHLPASGGKDAIQAAEYVEAIGRQDFKMVALFRERVFANHGRVRNEGEAYFKSLTRKLDVDMARLHSDLAEIRQEKLVKKDIDEAAKQGAKMPPFFVVNGVGVSGKAAPLENLINKILSQEKKKGDL
ncbi:DsbA family protein [Bdellovibrio bacteriovorus]|uniref:DsbA family protein n=1 Tax=Bdellovibrio bacteriovorus TaxID=959 RepID=UPI0035A5E3C3